MYLTIVLKLLVGMVGVLIFLRLTGKTQMANMTPLDSVNTIILGALVGSIIYMPETSIWVLVFAIVIWTLINMIVRWVLQINFFSKLIHGEAEYLIQDGKLNLKMLKRNNLGISQFRAKLREHDIYSLLDVDEVRFETDGKFTIFKHTEHSASFLLVSNGEIVEEELEESGKSKEWLENELEEQGFPDIKDIFCAEWTDGKGFYIITNEGEIINNKQKKGIEKKDKLKEMNKKED